MTITVVLVTAFICAYLWWQWRTSDLAAPDDGASEPATLNSALTSPSASPSTSPANSLPRSLRAPALLRLPTTQHEPVGVAARWRRPPAA